MDVAKLIEAARICESGGNCDECPLTNDCICDMWRGHALKIADYYEALLKAERASVIAEVREWADKNNSMDSYQRRMLRLSELRDHLDSMDKG